MVPFGDHRKRHHDDGSERHDRECDTAFEALQRHLEKTHSDDRSAERRSDQPGSDGSIERRTPVFGMLFGEEKTNHQNRESGKEESSEDTLKGSSDARSLRPQLLRDDFGLAADNRPRPLPQSGDNRGKNPGPKTTATCRLLPGLRAGTDRHDHSAEDQHRTENHFPTHPVPEQSPLHRHRKEGREAEIQQNREAGTEPFVGREQRDITHSKSDQTAEKKPLERRPANRIRREEEHEDAKDQCREREPHQIPPGTAHANRNALPGHRRKSEKESSKNRGEHGIDHPNAGSHSKLQRQRHPDRFVKRLMHSNPGNLPSFLIHNGALLAKAAAGVTVNDGAITCGQGAFETMAVYEGHPFLVAEHLQRLQKTATALGLTCPSEHTLTDAIHTLLSANGLETAAMARVRITLTAPLEGESWFVEATLPPSHPASARLITIPYVRNERGALAGLKTINYGENVIAMQMARDAGADEALFGNSRDLLCEGTWSNIFLYVEGRYLTPPLSSGCLPGVTRRLVLEILKELSLSWVESDFAMSDLGKINGAFLTSSLREIQPVASLDGRIFALPPGLGELKVAFRNRVARGRRQT